MRLPLAMALGMILIAGCFANDPVKEPGAGHDGRDLPPGCDPERTVVAHRAGGIVVPASATAPIPCFHRLATEGVEPTIGIDAAGAIYYYPADWFFLPVGGEARTVVSMARSTDEGATWQIVTPSIAGVPVHQVSADPAFLVDPPTGRIFAENVVTLPPCSTMAISDDGGMTWTPSAGGCVVAEHVTLFAGPPVSSPTSGYPRIVYRCGISGGAFGHESTMILCQRSLDGGMTWQPPGEPAYTFLPQVLHPVPEIAGVGPCFGGVGRGMAGPDGAVYLPRGHCGQPYLAISRDEAQTWTRIQVADLGNPCVENPEGPVCELDAGFGIDAAGTLFYAWVARDDRLPYLVRSFDGGVTWTAPLMVGAPGLNEAALVRLAAGGEGRIALAYYGTSSSPMTPFTGSYETTTWDAFMAVSYDAAADDPVFTTVRMNEDDDPLIRGTCGPVRCGAVYDFIDLRIAPDGTPWAPFVDGCFDPCELAGTEQRSEALTGRLWGGPSLWDSSDPNGAYP